MTAPDVEIVEVGPRDGLQNETDAIPVAEKIRLIDALSACGFRRIEAASFVSSKWVPQMAGSADVLRGLRRAAGVRYAALTPNLRGFQDALAAGADEVAIFASASEGFSKANINASIAESLTRFRPVTDAAKASGLRVRGYVSCVTDCPFDGPTPPAQTAWVTDALFELGVYEVSLGDTLGRGRPEQVDTMLDAILKSVDAERIAGHFHDTSGQALQNVDVALARGVRVFDAAVGGLGGCPYAPGAAGNLATEDLVAHLRSKGLTHGIDSELLSKAKEIAASIRGNVT